jgi:uncharacterized protein
VTFEPRVEELLETIRKAIDSDIDVLDGMLPSSTSSSSAGTLTRGSIREMRVSYGEAPAPKRDADESISILRERVGRQKIENKVSVQNSIAAPKPAARANPKPDGIGGILSGETKPHRIQPPMLRASYIDDEPEPVRFAEPVYEPPVVEHSWVEEAAAPMPEPYFEAQNYAPSQQALMSPQQSYSAQSSFQTLTDNIMARALGESDIEGMTRDMLRPMLKHWLDENLPPLVEKLVREEIERVARRGR